MKQRHRRSVATRMGATGPLTRALVSILALSMLHFNDLLSGASLPSDREPLQGV